MIREIEAHFKDAIFGAVPATSLDMPADRAELYRRLVRNNLFVAISSQLPFAKKLAGHTQFYDWFSRWLEEAPPKERIYWKLPVEFALWLHDVAGENDRFIAELAHYEAMQISCENAPNYEGGHHTFSEDAQIELDPSCRLCVYHFPVFLISKVDESIPTRFESPNFVLIYRRIEAAHWTILDPPVAQLLARLAEGDSISAGIEFIGDLYPDTDEGYLRSQLVKLNRFGALWRQSSCAK